MSSDRKTRHRPRERPGQGWRRQQHREKRMRKWWKERHRGIKQQRKTLRSWQKHRRSWRRIFWLTMLAVVTRPDNPRDRLLRARFQDELEQLEQRLPLRLLGTRPK